MKCYAARKRNDLLLNPTISKGFKIITLSQSNPTKEECIMYALYKSHKMQNAEHSIAS